MLIISRNCKKSWRCRKGCYKSRQQRCTNSIHSKSAKVKRVISSPTTTNLEKKRKSKKTKMTIKMTISIRMTKRSPLTPQKAMPTTNLWPQSSSLRKSTSCQATLNTKNMLKRVSKVRACGRLVREPTAM
jgi:hypothetical protein